MHSSLRQKTKAAYINILAHTAYFCFVPINFTLANFPLIYPCGDHAVTVELSNNIALPVHEKVMALFHYFSDADIPGIKDIIPAYTSITLVYDIAQVSRQTNLSAFDFICSKINTALQNLSASVSAAKLIQIPVCYDEAFGIDLPLIAQQKKISMEEIISIHVSTIYHVYMLGFLPGFAYMGIVDERIVAPRLPQPRMHVAAGSVGIAGNQTGIYPLDSPGGWNIIGKTPLSLFDASKDEPCLLQPGNTIQFIAISKEEFEQLKNNHEHPHY